MLKHKPDENPKTMKQLLRENQESAYFDAMTSKYNRGYDLHGQLARKVESNVYREFYDIPADLMVRKADSSIRQAVKSSQSLQAVKQMEQMSVNPTLIFFEKDMEEEHIQKVVDKLHGRHLKKNDSFKEFIVTMKQISDILTHGNP